MAGAFLIVAQVMSPDHLWHDTWTALSGPLSGWGGAPPGRCSWGCRRESSSARRRRAVCTPDRSPRSSRHSPAVPRRARILGLYTFVSLNSRLESNKEEEVCTPARSPRSSPHSPESSVQGEGLGIQEVGFKAGFLFRKLDFKQLPD